jgi:hypothetical protein
VSEAPPEVVEELYAAPPDEFVARRDALAKELRTGGDRDAADAVKKLRRPSVAAAAVNRLARDSADDVEALLAAGEALRQAQLGGGDRNAIRSAAHDERDAVEELVGKAGKLSPATVEEVRQTLHAAATDEETRELVRRGVLTEARRAAGFGGFSAVETPATAPPKKDSGAEQRRKEAERKRAARERVKEARAALREAEKALQRAERAADGARVEVERRREDLEAAESEV